MANSELDFNPPLEVARELILEYSLQLGVDLNFQKFETEMAEFPGKYAAPSGCLVVASVEGQPAGCGAFRPLEAGCCEMKRLYVRSAFRGHSLGRRIASALLDKARQAGYRTMRLDTLATMQAAAALYRSLGFQPIPAYYENHMAGTLFLEADLTARASL